MCPDPRTPVANSHNALVFHLFGQVAADDFPDWMEKHANKLGVTFEIVEAAAGCVGIRAVGAREMLDAFALACSLGPKSVCIDAVTFCDARVFTSDDRKTGA